MIFIIPPARPSAVAPHGKPLVVMYAYQWLLQDQLLVPEKATNDDLSA